MSQSEDNSLVAPIQSVSITEKALQQFLDHFHQRDAHNFEEEARRERELMERFHQRERNRIKRNHEDIAKLTTLLYHTVRGGRGGGGGSGGTISLPMAPSSPAPSPPAPSRLSRGPSPAPRPPSSPAPAAFPRRSTDLNKDDYPKRSFKPISFYRGALPVFGLKCTQTDCEWHGRKMELPDHLKTQHGLSSYRCLVIRCGKLYATEEDLLSHTERRHRGEVTCCECGRTSKDYDRLVKHFKRNHEEGYFECGVKGCKEGFTTQQAAYNHRQRKCPVRFPSLRDEGNSSVGGTRSRPIPPNGSRLSGTPTVTTEFSLKRPASSIDTTGNLPASKRQPAINIATGRSRLPSGLTG